ncbi:MAG: hypothetical protein HWD61_03060 [Parachlamydiaceae bacterium]|nr:MAG: hypothetical protein HWD61_03060 [Parachlamydiaceae bacterium]
MRKKYLKVKHFENDEIIDFDFNEENQFVIVTKKTITLWNSTKDQIYIKPFEQSDSNAVLFASYVRKKGEVFGTGELYVCRQKTIEVASISF